MTHETRMPDVPQFTPADLDTARAPDPAFVPPGPIQLGLPSVIVRPPTLDPTKVTFFDRGELAGFRVGDSELAMSYGDALRFSQMLRVHAKKAKRRAGDNSRHWSAVGTLTDLNG